VRCLVCPVLAAHDLGDNGTAEPHTRPCGPLQVRWRLNTERGPVRPQLINRRAARRITTQPIKYVDHLSELTTQSRQLF
jgi:hypothetical protein